MFPIIPVQRRWTERLKSERNAGVEPTTAPPAVSRDADTPLATEKRQGEDRRRQVQPMPGDRRRQPRRRADSHTEAAKNPRIKALLDHSGQPSPPHEGGIIDETV